MVKKSRLRKVAWEKITLYHATSSQVLVEIANGGQLVPGGYIDATSNGLAESKGPSGETAGVYLASGDTELGYYYDGAIENGVTDSNLPNFAVALKVSVDSDALTPDYDDIPITVYIPQWDGTVKDLREKALNRDGVPLWKQSLDQLGQVVHNGPIDVSQIESVKIRRSPMIFNQIGDMTLYSLDDYMSEFGLSFNSWIDFNTAAQGFKSLYEDLKQRQQNEEEQYQQTASRIRKRLQKMGKKD